MWPRWLCIFLCMQFTETCEKSQRRKMKKMQLVRQGIFLGMRFERNIKNTQWRNMKQMQPGGWKCLLQLNATSVIMNLLRNAIWRLLWKYTVEKSQTNATNVAMPPLNQINRKNVGKCTVDKNKQEQSVWLCILVGKRPDETHENAH